MLGFAIVGASSGPPDSTTSTWAPEADNSAARTEPAAPAPTTMKSYWVSSEAWRSVCLDGLLIVPPLGWLLRSVGFTRSEARSALEGVGGRLVPNCDPVVPGEFADDQLHAESANPAIFLPAKRPRGHIGDTVIVDVCHPRLNPQRKLLASGAISREHGAREPVLRVIGDPQRVFFPVYFDDGSKRAEQFVSGDNHLILDVDKHVRGQYQSHGIATDHLPRSSRARAVDMKKMSLELLLV